MNRYRLTRLLMGRLSRDPVTRVLQYVLAVVSVVVLTVFALAWLVGFIWTNKWWFAGAGALLYLGVRLGRRK